MAKVIDIDIDKQNAKAAIALYNAMVNRLTIDWPDISGLPVEAQTALNALRLNQGDILKVLKYIYQNSEIT